MSEKRIITELKKLKKSNHSTSFSISPKDSDIFIWEGCIFGPAETPYEGGLFNVRIELPDKYPFVPPSVNFITRIFHPNIALSGTICLDILDKNWSAALGIEKIMLSICSLLSDPNPDDPLNTEAATLYKNDRYEYDRQVKLNVIQYANG